MKIDVCLLTLDSNSPIFRKCLKRLEQEIPVNRLIVVDGGSQDGTLEVVKNYRFPVKIIDDSDGNRATARQKGIEAVETEYLLFLDDDVLLCENWWQQAKRFLRNEKFGAVWGVTIPAEPYEVKYFKAMAHFYEKGIIELKLRNGRKRGMTHDTLVKTELIKDISIPKSLHALEDEYIKRHIEEKDHLWIVTDTPYALHYKTSHSGLGAYVEGKEGRRMDLYDKSWFRKHFFKFLLKLGYLLVTTRSKTVVGRQLRKEVNYIRGWFSYE